MLIELAVRDLGVIEQLSLLVGPGMTALTGETGAGKTLVVEAIELLVGAKADPGLVRAGTAEATVTGRFELDGAEVVLTRVVPRVGRSRAYVDGRPAALAELTEWGARLVDLHGQHAHQSLLSGAVQRAALDRFGGVDLTPLAEARAALAALDAGLAALGGDERERAREMDLLRYQLDEIDAAAIVSADEEAALEAEEELLADAVALRDAAAEAVAALTGDGGEGGALDLARAALGALGGRGPLEAHRARVAGLVAELDDAAGELRAAGEAIEPDPERLAEVQARRVLLRSLRRKYGEDLAAVLGFAAAARARLDELASSG
ncbi:MAG: DNA repair protein RecN, partial [Acidimicrobiales bacterium]